MSDECKDFLRRVLVVDPARRITITEIQVQTISLLSVPLNTICSRALLKLE